MMMHSYGMCPCCRGEGALWVIRYRAVRRFWLFGKVTMRPVICCDECAPLEAARCDELTQSFAQSTNGEVVEVPSTRKELKELYKGNGKTGSEG